MHRQDDCYHRPACEISVSASGLANLFPGTFTVRYSEREELYPGNIQAPELLNANTLMR